VGEITKFEGRPNYSSNKNGVRKTENHCSLDPAVKGTRERMCDRTRARSSNRKAAIRRSRENYGRMLEEESSY
jgi:hypothetical protein